MFNYKSLIIAMLLVSSFIFGACTETVPSSPTPAGNFATEPAAAELADTATPTPAADAPLRIWWDEGYYPEEDTALQQIIGAWEEETGQTVELTFLDDNEMLRQLDIALETGNVPDIFFSALADWRLTPRLAWEGKLTDLSDVIEPVAERFSPATLQSVHFMNHTTEQRAYYAIPIIQNTFHIFYWKDTLATLGYQADDIPQDWEAFWAFWTDQQAVLRDKGERIFAIGMPLSETSSDTFQTFHYMLEAYGVRIADEDGNLQLDDPNVVEGVTQALAFQASFYQEDFVPRGAVTWRDPDNNQTFLNRSTLMTPNGTLSIPAAKFAERDVYMNQIGTMPWPDAPDGTPLPTIVAVKSATVPAAARNPEAAKAFLSFLIEPENLQSYGEQSLGRWVPVQPALLKTPFWSDGSDPHRIVVAQQFMERPNLFLPQLGHPAYAKVLDEAVWGHALARIALEDVPPAEAAAEAISQIKKIYAEFEAME